HWPVWAHDGKGFYFAMGDTEGFDLWRATLPDDAEQEVEKERVVDVDTHSVLFLTAAAEAPTLVYRHGFDLYRWNGDPQTAPKQIKLRAIGDGLRDEDELRRTLTSASEVAFHPDGLEIAMIAGGDVWVMDTTLREPVRVTDTPAYETSIT